jgi:short subunit dehydrogenase-like uncharacterized protein
MIAQLSLSLFLKFIIRHSALLLEDMMRKKYLLVLRLLVLVLMCVSASAARAQNLSRAKEKPLPAAQVKKRIDKLGVGFTACVRLTLRDGTEMEGYVGQAGEDHFYLVRTDEKSGTAAVVAYADVAELKGKKASLDWRSIHTGRGFGANFIVSLLQNLSAPDIKH